MNQYQKYIDQRRLFTTCHANTSLKIQLREGRELVNFKTLSSFLMEYSLQTTKINKTNMESITYKQYVLAFNVDACFHAALYKNSMFNILWIILG